MKIIFKSTQIAFDCIDQGHWKEPDIKAYICLNCFQQAIYAETNRCAEIADPKSNDEGSLRSTRAWIADKIRNP